MEAIKAEREAAQPLKVATGGSTFKNPSGHRAWQLIDQAGCRGLTHGAAMVSDKHCNFLINTGGATAAELETLGQMVQDRVEASYRHPPRMGNQAAGRGRGSRRAVQPERHQRSAFMTRHVAVLMGGLSAERDVSLVSGESCAAALEEKGYKVTRIDVGRDLAAQARRGPPGRRLQRAARPLRRGRPRAGPARSDGHPLHPFGRARLGAGDGQADGDAALPQRRPGLPRGLRDRVRGPAGRAAADGSALRRQAGGRRLERQRADRQDRRHRLPDQAHRHSRPRRGSWSSATSRATS